MASPNPDSSKSSPASFDETLLTFILALVNFTSVLDFVIMMPLGPQLMRDLSITAQEFSFLVSSYTVAASIFGFILANFIDRFDRKKSFLVLYAGFGIGTLMCGLSQTYVQILASRTLAGAFGGILTGMIFTIVGERIPAERRGRVTGIVMSAFAVASIFGLPAGLYLSRFAGWQMPFYCIALFCFLALILAWFKLPTMNSHVGKLVDGHKLSLKNVVLERNHLVGFGIISLAVLGQFMVIPFLSSFLVFNLQMGEENLPLVYLTGGIVTLFSSRAVGILADKHGLQKIFTLMSLAALVPVLLLTNLSPVPLPVVLAVTTLFMLSSSSRMVPMQALIISKANPNMRGGFMSMLSSVQHLASGLASLLGGLVVHQATVGGKLENYHLVGYGSAAGAVLSVFCAQLFKADSGAK